MDILCDRYRMQHVDLYCIKFFILNIIEKKWSVCISINSFSCIKACLQNTQCSNQNNFFFLIQGTHLRTIGTQGVRIIHILAVHFWKAMRTCVDEEVNLSQLTSQLLKVSFSYIFPMLFLSWFPGKCLRVYRKYLCGKIILYLYRTTDKCPTLRRDLFYFDVFL